MANQPRKVETDTLPPASGKHHVYGKGRRQKQRLYRYASLRNHDPSPGRREAENPRHPAERPAARNRKANFQESSQQANQARKTPQGIAQVNDNTRQAAEADPNPRRGRTATGREEGPRLTSPSVRVPQTQDPPEARTVKCGTYNATEQNGLPKEGTKPPRGKAGPLVRTQL